jgi:hypothetical protein
MTGQRRGYAIALAVAVLTLLVSVGAAMSYVTTGSTWSLNGAAPAPSDGWRQGLGGGGMMGQGRATGGMMGNWSDQDTTIITAAQARTSADAWAAANQPGATVGPGIQMPMGYLFQVTQGAQNVGTIIVNDDTGQVGWVGSSQPTPTARPS